MEVTVPLWKTGAGLSIPLSGQKGSPLVLSEVSGQAVAGVFDQIFWPPKQNPCSSIRAGCGQIAIVLGTKGDGIHTLLLDDTGNFPTAWDFPDANVNATGNGSVLPIRGARGDHLLAVNERF